MAWSGTLIGRRLSHYRVLSELGAGGMGVVYKARDEKLPRLVAIKVLRPEYSDDEPRRRRFLREACAAAAVEHPYIASIHEADEEEDTLFIAMEFVEGSTLRSILAAEPLPVGTALRHGVEIAEGLAHAHESRVIHRDLKPSNIMISCDGHAKILDFGLAKLMEQRDEATSSLLSEISTLSLDITQRTARVGTPAYMSPEQVRGANVDHRSDLFAFGVTLHESLTGQSPFGRLNQADTLAAILRDTPLPVSSLNPDVPQDLERILDKCMAKDPDARLQDTRTLVDELEELRWEWESAAKRRSNGGTRTLSSMGSEVSSRDSRVVEPAKQNGSAASAVRAVARGSGARRRGKTLYGMAAVLVAATAIVAWRLGQSDGKHASEVFYERGLHYLREESENVRSVDDAIHMFHRALAADSASARAWAKLGHAFWLRYSFTKEQASREEAERSVARAFALEPELPEAYLALGKGLVAQSRYTEALEPLRRALESGEHLDEVWALFGRVHRGLGNYAEGLEAIQTAIQLNPQSFKHRISLGNFYRQFRERNEAEKAYREAIALKPTSTMAWTNLGSVVLMNGELEEAANAFRRSLAIAENASSRSNLGTTLYFMGDYEGAAANYRMAVEQQPNKMVHYQNLCDALIMLGEEDELQRVSAHAIDLVRAHAESAPDDATERIRLGVFCARAGDVDCALDAARRAEELQPNDPGILFRCATVFCILNRPDDALDRLEKAIRMGLNKVEIENDPDLRHLREHPRYKKALELAS